MCKMMQLGIDIQHYIHCNVLVFQLTPTAIFLNETHMSINNKFAFNKNSRVYAPSVNHNLPLTLLYYAVCVDCHGHSSNLVPRQTAVSKLLIIIITRQNFNDEHTPALFGPAARANGLVWQSLVPASSDHRAFQLLVLQQTVQINDTTTVVI